MKKKDFPLQVLKDLQELKLKLSTDVVIQPAKDTLLNFIDKDPNSGFYFSIIDYRFVPNKFIYTVKKSPTDRLKIEPKNIELSYNELVQVLTDWQKLISEYNDQEFFTENDRLNNYAREFYGEFKILDEDADINPFDLRRQLLLDEYLDNSITFIKEYQTENKLDLSSLIESANEIKRTQSQLSKNETIKKLSKFWAMSRDKGIPILKKVLFEFAKDLLFEYGKKLIIGN